MSDSAAPLGTVAIGQGDQVTKANALFDAVSPVAVYAKKYATTSGLTLGYHGGKVLINGVITTIADGTIVLVSSTTNYLEADPATGVVSKNGTAYTPGYWPIGRAVTGAAAVTTWYDDRLLGGSESSTLAKALSDANTTLTQPEAACSTLTFTGTLTATRNITVPLVGKRQWTVYNGTGQILQFIGPSGTGITVATLKNAIVRSDGTNIVRVTADT